jgi:hypothetical protein
VTPAPDTTTSPSPAQQAANDRAATAQAVIAASAAATTAALQRVRHLLPDRWHAACHQAIIGATHTVAIDPPPGVVDATAYLMPRTGDHDGTVSGWSVRVHNRQQRVNFPLYTDGGARAAVYTSVDDAVTAAITVLRVEAVPTVSGRPR